MRMLVLLPLLATAGCLLQPQNAIPPTASQEEPTRIRPRFAEGSWEHFLQQLPTSDGPVVDYQGNPVARQDKHTAIVVGYDVGTRDLQQCADALMRLRAEYLFGQKRYAEIRFHFTCGDLYRYQDYLKGMRPVEEGRGVRFVSSAAPVAISQASLRRYLDIVYTYAGTLSLARELKDAPGLSVGTVILKAGSPGHCSMVVDEATDSRGEKLYKLVEGYTPAQSIYILRNPVYGGPWYKLQAGRPIVTSSYYFDRYQLKAFE